MLWNMDKWFKDILPDKDPYHNRGRDQMRKKGGPEFECLWSRTPRRYCHLITLVTNVFLTTVGTATPPGGGDGWMVSIAIFWIEMTNVRLPIYDGQIRVIYVDYLLLSCMPVYMLLYVCYMHMIPSFHNKWHFHFKLVFESRPSNGAPAVLTKSTLFFCSS
jgi:hypothetical protein